MKKQASLFWVLVMGVLLLNAQQDPQFTGFQTLSPSFNPANTALGGNRCVYSAYRSQWVNFPGAPRTFILGTSWPVRVLKGGIGLTFISDKLGNEKNNIARFSYAFHLYEIGGGTLAIGLESGWHQKTLDGPWVAPQGTAGDNVIPVSKASAGLVDISGGVFYKARRFYTGISVTQIPESQFRKNGLYYGNKRHYYFTAGGKFWLGALPAIEFRPHFLLKTDMRSYMPEVSLLGWFNGRFYGGAGYRLQDALIVHAGFRWANMQFGYSYDITTSDISNHSRNTHELCFKYCFRVRGVTTVHINPSRMHTVDIEKDFKPVKDVLETEE